MLEIFTFESPNPYKKQKKRQFLREIQLSPSKWKKTEKDENKNQVSG